MLVVKEYMTALSDDMDEDLTTGATGRKLAECQRRLREMESWVDRHAGERFWVPA